MLKNPEKIQKLCIYMPLDMALWVKKQAEMNAISKSAIVKQILAKEIRKYPKSESSKQDLGGKEERSEGHEEPTQ